MYWEATVPLQFGAVPVGGGAPHTPNTTSSAVVFGATGTRTLILPAAVETVMLLVVPGTLGLVGSTENISCTLFPTEPGESNSTLTALPVLKSTSLVAGCVAEFRLISTSGGAD